MYQYKGKKYRSIKDLGEELGITPHRLKRPLALGLSVEDAVEKIRRLDAWRKENSTDHKGITYASIEDMCRAYGVGFHLYEGRVHNGMMSKEQALTKPIRDTRITAPDGKTYPSKVIMCLSYGINVSTYENRLRKGMSMAEALTTPINRTGRGAISKESPIVTDHLGNHYSCTADMCRAYSINPNTYRRRRFIQRLSVKDALTIPVREHKFR